MAAITETGKHVFAATLTEVGERIGPAILTEIGELVVGGAPTINPSSIGSAEAFGVTALVYAQNVLPSSIGSDEAFGTAALSILIAAVGIESAEAFGSLFFNPNPTGIASGEAIGDAVIFGTSVQVIFASSIESAEAVNGVEFGVFLNFFEYETEVVSEGGQLVVKKRIVEGTGHLVASLPKPAGWFHPWGQTLIRLS